jgi:macrolide-specific efflux system membrane fusion protein
MADKKPRKKRRRGLVFALLVAAAGAGLWFGWQTYGASPDAAAAAATVTIQRGDIEDTVTAQGKLEPKEYVDVGAQVSGQLKKLHVEIGDVVKEGDLLAEIDPQIYEAKVEADEAHLKTLNAQLAEQNANVTQAQQKLERSQALIKAHATSQQDLQDSETALKVAEAQRAALQAQIEEQQSTLDGDKANLGYSTIYAPMAGTVVTQTTREGQTLNANQSAPTLLQLADLDTMTVRAQVAEADVMRLKPDTPVYFTTFGSKGRRWEGKVRQILPSPEVINDVVLYDVLVDVDNKDRQLMTGMSTQMFFVLGEAKDVPVIPVAALGKHLKKKDSEAGQAYRVKLTEGGAVTPVIVHIGLMDRTSAEIKDGLKEGDIVMLPAPAGGGAASGANAGQGGARRGGVGRGPRL